MADLFADIGATADVISKGAMNAIGVATNIKTGISNLIGQNGSQVANVDGTQTQNTQIADQVENTVPFYKSPLLIGGVVSLAVIGLIFFVLKD